MSIVFVVLLGTVYFVQQSNIKQLEEKLSSLSPNSKVQELPVDKNAPTLQNRVTALAQLVDSQVIELHELKKAIQEKPAEASSSSTGENISAKQLEALEVQIANIKSKIESLQAPAAPQSANNAVPIKFEAMEAQIEAIKSNIEALQTPVAPRTIGNNVPTVEFENLETQIEDLRSKVEALSATAPTPSAIDPVQLQAAVTQAIQAQSKAIEYQSAQLNALQDDLSAGLDVERRVTAELSKLETNVDQKVENLSYQLDDRLQATKESVETLVSQAIDKSLSETKTKLMGYQSELDELSTQVAVSTQAKASNIDSSEFVALLTPIENQLAPLKQQVQTLVSGLEETKRSVAPLEKRVNDLTAYADQTRSSLVPLRNELDQVASDIAQTEASFNEWQKNIDNRLSATTKPSSSPVVSSSELTALKQSVRSQLSDLNELKARDRELSNQIAAANRELKAMESAIAGLDRTGGGVSVASAPALDIGKLEAEIASLETKANSTLSRIRANESQLVSWQRRIENQLSATSSAPAANGGLSAVEKETIQLLKKQHPYTDFPGDN